MILKKAHSVDMTKLHTVILSESEANHTNKWISKLAMVKALKFDYIAPE